MRILLDHSVPSPIRHHLHGHEVVETVARGWERLDNGALLTAAEKACFDVFITSDKNLRYQQNLAGRKIALVILGHGQWPAIRPHVDRVLEAVNAANPGSVTEVEIPYPNPKAGDGWQDLP
jgi:hypothetical protein